MFYQYLVFPKFLMPMCVDVVNVEDSKVELHTLRLRLRGAVEGDAAQLSEAFADPEVMRYWYAHSD